MKKIYTLIAGLLLAGTASSQVLVNGSFEGTVTHPVPAFPSIASMNGWGGLFQGETTAPANLMQNVKLTTEVNAALAAAAGLSSDTISGQISQSIDGPVANPAGLTVTFQYKYAPVNTDTAVFVVEVYDTLAAGAGDDELLYQGVSIMTGNVSTWSNKTITLTNAGGSGTANQVYMLAGSSIGGFFNGFVAPRPGSALSLDNVRLSSGNAGVEENALSGATIYPNPVSDMLNFDLNGNDATSVSIYSLDGKLLISQDANGATGSVNVSSLNTGMYIYQIATAAGESVKSTFVKK